MDVKSFLPDLLFLFFLIFSFCQSCNRNSADSQLQKKIHTRIKKEQSLQQLKVSVKNGIVHLGGICTDSNKLKSADSMIRHFEEVKLLINQVVVLPGRER